MDAPRVTSVGTLRFERFGRAIPKLSRILSAALDEPKALRSLVRRTFSRAIGSLGGSLWTFLNPLLLMTTYFVVFESSSSRGSRRPSRSGFVLYLLAGCSMDGFRGSRRTLADDHVRVPEFCEEAGLPLETLR